MARLGGLAGAKDCGWGKEMFGVNQSSEDVPGFLIFDGSYYTKAAEGLAQEVAGDTAAFHCGALQRSWQGSVSLAWAGPLDQPRALCSKQGHSTGNQKIQ